MKEALLFLLFIFTLFSCGQKRTEYSKAEFCLGSVCQVRLLTTKPKKEAEKIFVKIFSELKKLDLIFNANTENPENKDSGICPQSSELELVNKNAGIKAVEVSDELFSVLEFSLLLAKKTDGAFNPAIGNLVKLWDIGFSGKTLPANEKIRQSLERSDYRKVILNKENNSENSTLENFLQEIQTENILQKNGNTKTDLNCVQKKSVFLEKNGMRLDLGGIAKGFTADRVAEIIKNEGIQDALIDIGGNIFALGKNIKNEDWIVGLKNPNIGEKGIATSVKISGQSLVTSGNYERFFKYENKIYHHILDSKTGVPVENNLNAVSIVADSSMLADALSTTCFALGIKKSAELIAELNAKTDKNITAFFFFDNKIKVIGVKPANFSVFEPFKISE